MPVKNLLKNIATRVNFRGNARLRLADKRTDISMAEQPMIKQAEKMGI